ncbi:SufE family protein [Granulosicoccus antarcticus]|uniref:Cysteine desulfuration protein SufE n=1 Tax=Granulosicoccus antarcticus IMCC3135 TaxID=1192854 RepID=A0A2Z2NZE0_9GAMM|nr:SufE family protein [Granulosicoccus antarcticus]ASJ75795.1 Cysteine desulfuration protein SufE [Granulosicoccus antarcticus IMCC3135]
MAKLPSSTEIIDDLAFFDDWEERYQYIIDLSKQLPVLSDADRTDDRLVKGCQSSVWLKTNTNTNQDKLHFSADSDAIIVKGLLVLVLAAYQDKSAQEILEFDMDGYFKELDLERHITVARGNGLRSIVGKIRQEATQA